MVGGPDAHVYVPSTSSQHITYIYYLHILLSVSAVFCMELEIFIIQVEQKMRDASGVLIGQLLDIYYIYLYI